MSLCRGRERVGRLRGRSREVPRSTPGVEAGAGWRWLSTGEVGQSAAALRSKEPGPTGCPLRLPAPGGVPGLPRCVPGPRPSRGRPREEGLRQDFKDAQKASVLLGPQSPTPACGEAGSSKCPDLSDRLSREDLVGRWAEHRGSWPGTAWASLAGPCPGPRSASQGECGGASGSHELSRTPESDAPSLLPGGTMPVLGPERRLLASLSSAPPATPPASGWPPTRPTRRAPSAWRCPFPTGSSSAWGW